MYFSQKALLAVLSLYGSSVSGFVNPRPAFSTAVDVFQSSSVVSRELVSPKSLAVVNEKSCNCSCGKCNGGKTPSQCEKQSECSCEMCQGRRKSTALLMSTTEEAVPTEASPDSSAEEKEARVPVVNKKGKKGGKPLDEFSVGDILETATIKSIASYGAFVDIGATTDALLHVSQLADDFVSDVSSVVKEGQVLENKVRILKIDLEAGKVALTLKSPRADGDRRGGGGGGGNFRADRAAQAATIQALAADGYDSDIMVDGTVVSTLDFGAFVKVDANAFRKKVQVAPAGEAAEGDESESEGETVEEAPTPLEPQMVEGLVHISAMRTSRVNKVSDVVKVNDVIKVRIRSLDKSTGKVSLSMLTAAEEPTMGSDSGPSKKNKFFSKADMGPEDWKEQLESFNEKVDMPAFKNMPLVVDRRNK